MIETWKPVAISPAHEVSDFGRVRRIFDCPKTGRKAGTFTKPEVRRGALMYSFGHEGRRVRMLAHRLVMEAFGPAMPQAGMIVAHNDGDHTNNHIGNLRWATYRENTADRIVHGTDRRGSQCSQALLTEADVAFILEQPRVRGVCIAMAERFGVSRATISKIVNGKNWAHVRPPTR